MKVQVLTIARTLVDEVDVIHVYPGRGLRRALMKDAGLHIDEDEESDLAVCKELQVMPGVLVRLHELEAA